jgi:hypothetical protein
MGYKDTNDSRYYVPVTVYSESYNKNARVNFVIDTGATRTQLSWIDVSILGVIIRNLPRDKATFIGMGQEVRGYLLRQCILIFNSNIGKYDLPVGDLSVSDYQTMDGKQCSALPSVLGIDVLDQFDLLFETYGRVLLRKK